MKLSLTYSAYRELEQIARNPLKEISQSIVDLAQDPTPAGSVILEGNGGCRCLAIEDYQILYHIDGEQLTVIGVVLGAVQTLH